MQPFQALLPQWQQLRQAARDAQHAPAVAVHAGDVSFRMTDFAQRNAERAGVAHAISFKTVDAVQRAAPAPQGVLICNPPYGERLAPKGQGSGPRHTRVSAAKRAAQRHEQAAPAPQPARESFDGGGSAAEFFSALAAHLKRQYSGWQAWVLSPEMKLPGLMRLKESRRVPLWNGAIECRLFRFDLVSGSMRPGSATPIAPITSAPPAATGES